VLRRAEEKRHCPLPPTWLLQTFTVPTLGHGLGF
jgi:hypothetical protein